MRSRLNRLVRGTILKAECYQGPQEGNYKSAKLNMSMRT